MVPVSSGAGRPGRIGLVSSAAARFRSRSAATSGPSSAAASWSQQQPHVSSGPGDVLGDVGDGVGWCGDGSDDVCDPAALAATQDGSSARPLAPATAVVS